MDTMTVKDLSIKVQELKNLLASLGAQVDQACEQDDYELAD